MITRKTPKKARSVSDRLVTRARRILRLRLAELRNTYGVQGLWLFGSHVRGEARAHSDLDLLVEFDHDSTLSLLEFIALENRLSDWLGVPVDLVEKSGLRPTIGQRVLQEAVPV